MFRCRFILATALLIGCASTEEWLAKSNAAKVQEAKKRAAFDLECKEEEVSNNFTSNYPEGHRYAGQLQQVGFAGCQKKVMYVRDPVRSQWIRN